MLHEHPGEIWSEWAVPDQIFKAGKHVGISKEGLSVKWLDQSKFEQAETILSPPTPGKFDEAIPMVRTPEGVRRNSTEYWKSLYLQGTEQVSSKVERDYMLENVPGLLPTF